MRRKEGGCAASIGVGVDSMDARRVYSHENGCREGI